MTPAIHLNRSAHQRDRLHRLYQDGLLDGPQYLRVLRETPQEDDAELRFLVPVLVLFVAGAITWMVLA